MFPTDSNVTHVMRLFIFICQLIIYLGTFFSELFQKRRSETMMEPESDNIKKNIKLRY